MRELLPFLIIGTVSGSLYGLAGIGLVLTYRTSGVFNFGHGSIAAGGAFLFYTLHYDHSVPWPIAAILTIVLFGLVGGWILERLTRGVGDVPEAVVVVATVGVLLGVQGLLRLVYGDYIKTFPQFLPTNGTTVFDVKITWAQVISVGIATASAIGLYVFLRRSRTGVAMRAVVENPTLVALAGESPGRVRLTAWCIGSSFAALSGILLAPTLGLDASLLTFLVIQAFGACAIGMFKSLPLTYLGGIIVGIVASLSTKYFTDPPLNGLPPGIPFVILVAVLLAVAPRKLPQRRASMRSILPDVKSMPPGLAMSAVGAGALALLIVPHFVGTRLPLWTGALVNAIIFCALALLIWVSGQISLCHMAFVAIGIVAMARFSTESHLPWLVSLLLAGLVTMPVGALVAIPAIRLSGLYLALATLGFGVLLQYVFYPRSFMFTSALTVTVARPVVGSFDGNDDKQFYYLVLAIAAVCIAAMWLLVRSRLGRILRAMSETPTMLTANGLDVSMSRLIAFTISAFFAGIAGALAVTQFGSASGTAYGPIQSLIFVAVLAICGTRLLSSSILAAILLTIVPGYVDGFGLNQQMFAFGVLAVAASIIIAKRDHLRDAVRALGFRADKPRRPLIPTPPLEPRAPRANDPRVPVGMSR
jgi:branched-subunit amino acid ABC-type transport system permease component